MHTSTDHCLPMIANVILLMTIRLRKPATKYANFRLMLTIRLCVCVCVCVCACICQCVYTLAHTCTHTSISLSHFLFLSLYIYKERQREIDQLENDLSKTFIISLFLIISLFSLSPPPLPPSLAHSLARSLPLSLETLNMYMISVSFSLSLCL
jgi:hypothetical protein